MAEPAQLPKREPAHEEPAKTNAVRELGGIREEFIDRVGTLRASLDDSSKVSRNLTFIFLLVGLYIAILGGATDHARLLRGGEIAMPLLNIGVSLVWFYGLAPPLFLLMHFNLLLQLYFLSQKAHRFEAALKEDLADDPEARKEQRGLLFTFPFTLMVLSEDHPTLLRRLLEILVFVTLAALPAALLLWMQLRFLPYQSAAITTIHKACLTLDLMLVWLFWPTYGQKSGSWLAWWDQCLDDRQRLWPFKRDLTSRSVRALIVCTVGLVAFSWLVAVRPHSSVDNALARALFHDGRFFVSRSLHLPGFTLLSREPAPELIAKYEREKAFADFAEGYDLEGRSLRNATLPEANLFKAKLAGADLQGADLGNANFQGAVLQNADLRGADLGNANFQGAELRGADLQGANLAGADLQGADLRGANLRVADLIGADLQGAVFCNYAGKNCVNFQRARLLEANLQGAVLRGADLQGADLRGANLQGAFLAGADLGGAFLEGANLQGARLFYAGLQGADLKHADLQGADLRHAQLWRANVGADPGLVKRWRLADLRGVDVDPIEDLDAWIEEARVPGLLRGSLRHRSDVPRFPEAALNVMFDPGDPLPERLRWGMRVWETNDAYEEDLASFLGELACSEDATEHVARGLARRAVYHTERSRLYAKLLAARLIGDDCPPAAGLPEDMRKRLEQLAAGP